MSWRTVVISSRCKLDLSLGYLEVRGETTTKIHLSEIAVLMVESTAVSLTAGLLCELTHRGVKVIFCDEKRNPQSELIPHSGSFDSSAKARQQVRWPQEIKDSVWAQIVVWKIRKQQALLRHVGQQERAEQLGRYAADVAEGDSSNREGHAAKVYFGGLFGLDFTRGAENGLNAALNYGYAILLSAFNREIAGCGYLTQFGIFHDNMFNPLNLASDLMEPFRPLVDRIVRDEMPEELSRELKLRLVGVLNRQVEIDGSRQYVLNAIRIYCRSVFNALNERDLSELRMYGNEL